MNYMLEAIKLAEHGKFSVAPNPLVGCVIVKDGKIVGQGWHHKAGQAHAEIIALREAAKNAVGADVYVTLEPCSHFGQTPPCVDALIQAKVKSVHIPYLDPNPLVNGKGVEKLRAAGIEVHIGEEADSARKQNAVFLHYISTKRPYIVAKWAMSFDGRIKTDTGDSKWITGIEARKHSHLTRARLGAILVGAGTIVKDNPRLTPHLLHNPQLNAKSPIRIVLDASGVSPLTAQIFNSSLPQTTFAVTTELSAEGWRKSLEDKGINVCVLPSNVDNKTNLDLLLDELGKKQISGLLVEGGQSVLTSFVNAKLINEIHAYVAPKIIGGNYNCAPLAACGINSVASALKLNIDQYEKLGDDFFISTIPSWE